MLTFNIKVLYRCYITCGVDSMRFTLGDVPSSGGLWSYYLVH